MSTRALAGYRALADAARDAGGTIDRDEFARRLLDFAAEEYRHGAPSARLVEFSHGPATYVFDDAGAPQAERTVLAVAHPEPPADAREVAYQRGYPLPDRFAGRAVDRGHFVPYTAGGLFGPNLFVQDRALNRGWSREGRAYRVLERAAVAGAPATAMFVRPLYVDDGDIPGFLDLGVIAGSRLDVQRFRNRFDAAAGDGQDALTIQFAGATDAQIGALGEETAAGLLENDVDATVVAMGDAGLPREGSRQDLDLLAIIDGALIAVEVKTRYRSSLAGHLTRAGNLRRPRLRRPRSAAGDRQGSQAYVTDRLAASVDTGDGYEGVDVRVIAIDFCAMLAQQFTVDDTGAHLRPLEPPVDCTGAAQRALAQIIGHRGHL